MPASRRQTASAAQRAVDRLTRLQSVTAALVTARTPEQVATVIIEHGLAALGATAGSVTLLSDDGTTLETVAARGYPPEVLSAWRRFPITMPTMMADALRAGKPLFIPTLAERNARYPQLPAIQAIGGSNAWAALPLISEGHVSGGLGLAFAQPQAFPTEDCTFMLTLAQQCAQALERAQLYAAEQRARTSAEQTVRLRDHFLQIASHELRSPLTSLLGYVNLLQRRMEQQGTLAARELQLMQKIMEQTTRLNKRVNALLDLSQIATGRLRLECLSLDLCSLMRDVVEGMQFESPHHPISYQASDEALFVYADAGRLEQVLQNLLGNAIKYSAPGTPVVVDVRRQGEQACVGVTDQGIGIPQEALPHLFEQFYQAANIDPQQTSGAGLGLYVANSIVDLHGGRIEVRSQEGIGSTFTMYLPLRRG